MLPRAKIVHWPQHLCVKACLHCTSPCAHPEPAMHASSSPIAHPPPLVTVGLAAHLFQDAALFLALGQVRQRSQAQALHGLGVCPSHHAEVVLVALPAPGGRHPALQPARGIDCLCPPPLRVRARWCNLSTRISQSGRPSTSYTTTSQQPTAGKEDKMYAGDRCGGAEMQQDTTQAAPTYLDRYY
jgi:hypothetical protein